MKSDHTNPLGRIIELRNVRLILLCVLAIQGFVIWVRTPYLPAAGAGDEVWFSESGYYLLTEGVLKRPMFADAMGSAVHDMYPPLIGIGQAISFRIFGITAFGMMALSSIIFSSTVILFYLNIRRFVQPGRALLGSCALLGPFLIERHLLAIRPESLIAPLFLGSTYLWIAARDRRVPAIHEFSAGIAGGLACLCYYPHSPFVLIGLLALTLPFERAQFPAWLRYWMGVVVVGAGAALWIATNWTYFDAQILDLGRRFYGLNRTDETLAAGQTSGGKTLIYYAIWVEYVMAAALLFAAVIVQWPKNRMLSRIALAGLAGLVPIFFLRAPAQPAPISLVSGGIIGLYALVTWPVDFRSKWASASALVALGGLAILSLAKVGAMAAIVALERPARLYEPIEAGLARVISQPGKIGFSQRAWLGLRKIRGPDELHFMVNYLQSPQCSEQRSLVLRDPERLKEFSYFVVDRVEQGDLEAGYPIFKEAIESHEFVEIARIQAPKQSHFMTKSVPYDLRVFGREK